MNEQAALENLKEIKDIFDKIGVEFWLDHGTLLGAFRDGKIIEWDSDVDLGTWYDNAKKITSAFPEFKKRGFWAYLNKKEGTMGAKRHGCHTGVSLYRKRNDYAWTVHQIREIKYTRIEKLLHWLFHILEPMTFVKPEWKSTRKSEPFSSLLPFTLKRLSADIMWSILDRRGHFIPLAIPITYFEKLSTIQFYGIEFKTPFNVEKYLNYRYGGDWKIPRKNWKYKDDGAIDLNGPRLCDFLCVHIICG